MAKQFTLGKNERLKSRKSIEQLFSEGKKITVAPYKVLYMLVHSASEFPLLFGVGVSAKNFKKAVDRNRIKRLTKEAWRLQKKELRDKLKERNIRLNVFFIYTGKELPEYNEVYKKTGSVLKKLDMLTGE
ncbi:MAG: ribonuclease P protein component [Bacteroidota bacterium]|nr:ribonuclease P protein component [Bacteroidota bacterium]